MSTLNITVCPNCGSQKIKRVRKTVSGTREGKRTCRYSLVLSPDSLLGKSRQAEAYRTLAPLR